MITNLVIYLIILTILALPLGKFIANVFQNKVNFFNFIEKPIYKLLGTNPDEEQNWKEYAVALMVFNLCGILVLFLIQIFQHSLPLNPQKIANMKWDLALNNAISFVANTNWQAYAGETMVSYFTQMIGLAVQNFVSAATGLAVVIALIRGFSRNSSQQIGSFWVDLVRGTLYILLPLSIIISCGLISQGVPQNLSSYQTVKLIDPEPITLNKTNSSSLTQITNQTLPMGPIASQEAIKLLGTNGGGFFNANSAHPFENPTALSNFIEMLAILLIPAALCFSFGHMVNDPKQGYTIFATMTIVFVLMAVLVMYAESKGNPLFNQLNINQLHTIFQSGGNMEGKETRFGIIGSGLFAAITTAASCGAVNAMHDSFMPLGGLAPLFLMQLSEVIFGGVGSGLYGMLVFAILAVFICGLMIGRTPEYLGKKIESFEMKMTALIILVVPILVLSGTAISLVISPGNEAISNPGAHGLSEVLYAFTSAANNNGSAFAGLNANTLYYNLILSITIFFGRFGIIIPILAIAGSLASKKKLPFSSGSMPTTGILFILILLGTIIVVGALTYVPSLALGPIVEHLQLYK